jgi:hypothetical protein
MTRKGQRAAVAHRPDRCPPPPPSDTSSKGERRPELSIHLAEYKKRGGVNVDRSRVFATLLALPYVAQQSLELGWQLLLIFCSDCIATYGTSTRRRTTGFVYTPLKRIYATSVSHYSPFLAHFKVYRCILMQNYPRIG